MIIGYMRVSSENDRQNTNLQQDALLKAGVDPRHLFGDKASGTKDKRPGLKQAFDFLHKGDCLGVWKLDRLGRSLSHLLHIINDLHNRSIAFKSLTEHMDTTTALGELLFNLFGPLAQYERTLTTERIMAGLEAAKCRGRIGSRPKVIDHEKMNAVRESLNAGASKASCLLYLNIKRFTPYDALN